MGSLKSDGTWNYYWKRGRELGSMVSGNTTWTYSYNGDGIRIGRTDGTNTYTYIYNGDKLTRVQYNGNLVRYNYDESGNPISLRYNNVLYFVDTNLQGDVVGIRQTSDNARVVNYVYDAYGKICSITGTLKDTLGVHNVLRYRGYVYDNETGLYYLQSRYYNPEWGRFISADGAYDTKQGISGHNMYVYCVNNPANMYDPDGRCGRFLGFLWKIDCKQASCPDSQNYIAPKFIDPVGTYNNGAGYVYVVKESQLNEIMTNIEPNAVVAVDKRMNTDDPQYNQNIQIRYSHKITNPNHQKEIIKTLCSYNAANPVSPAWNRTEGSMYTEWQAHNHGFLLSPLGKLLLNRDVSDNCEHVDFDNKDEDLGYWDYYRK